MRTNQLFTENFADEMEIGFPRSILKSKFIKGKMSFFPPNYRASERASKASKKLGAPPGKRPHQDSVIFFLKKGLNKYNFQL